MNTLSTSTYYHEYDIFVLGMLAWQGWAICKAVPHYHDHDTSFVRAGMVRPWAFSTGACNREDD